MAAQKKYSVIIIGSGAALKIAPKLAKAGLKVALIEKGNLGGTCLNRGCIPSKMFIYPSYLSQMLKLGECPYFDIDYKGFDIEKLTQHIYRTTQEESQKIAKTYTSGNLKNVDLYRGSARFVGVRKIEVNSYILTAETIVIAVGARPFIPEIPGLEKTPYLTSTEALRIKEIPKETIIIGGGYIGCEIGSAYESFGSKVTYLTKDGFLNRLDSEVREEFTKNFLKRVSYFDNCQINSVSYNESSKKFGVCVVTQEGESKVLDCDGLLVAAGVVPNCDMLCVGKGGLLCDEKGFLKVDEYLETNVKGIYALGDCVGTFMFRHSANFQAEYLAELLLSKERKKISYPPIPFAIFTYPQIAGVGKCEDELISESIGYVKGIAFYRNSAIGQAITQNCGFVKLLFCSKTQKLLGASCIGYDASTLIHIPLVVLSHNLGLCDMEKVIYIHPTLGEIVRDAVKDAKRDLGLL